MLECNLTKAAMFEGLKILVQTILALKQTVSFFTGLDKMSKTHWLRTGRHNGTIGRRRSVG